MDQGYHHNNICVLNLHVVHVCICINMYLSSVHVCMYCMYVCMYVQCMYVCMYRTREVLPKDIVIIYFLKFQLTGFRLSEIDCMCMCIRMVIRGSRLRGQEIILFGDWHGIYQGMKRGEI